MDKENVGFGPGSGVLVLFLEIVRLMHLLISFSCSEGWI